MKKIICGQFKQETNRYSPNLSDEQAYRERQYIWEETAIRAHFTGTKTELGFVYSISYIS